MWRSFDSKVYTAKLWLTYSKRGDSSTAVGMIKPITSYLLLINYYLYQGGIFLSIINTPKSISIDFNSNEIRIVEGKVSKKGIQISKYFSIGIPSEIYQDGIINDMDQLSYLLKTGLSENKISLGNTYAVINSSEIIIREVLFPKVDDKDIDNLIKYQLGDYIPIHPEDYVVKYINLGYKLDNGVEKLTLLLIGIPTNMVENHFNLLKNIGLKPQVLDYKGNSICKLLSAFGDINGQSYLDRTIAFIDINMENAGLTIIKDEFIMVSRIIEQDFSTQSSDFNVSKFSYEDFIKSLNVIDDISLDFYSLSEDNFSNMLKRKITDLMDKIEMIFRYYRTREMGNSIDLIIIHGELAKVNGIAKVFTDFFKVESTILNSKNKLRFDGDLSLYANAIGGLIRLDGVKA